jgi:hypothetical protein
VYRIATGVPRDAARRLPDCLLSGRPDRAAGDEYNPEQNRSNHPPAQATLPPSVVRAAIATHAADDARPN